MGRKKQAVQEKAQRMVICWRCTHAKMIRVQGEAQAERAVCYVSEGQKGVLISDPHNPPKSCVVAQAWAKEDAANG